jgi:hypothetical protein
MKNLLNGRVAKKKTIKAVHMLLHHHNGQRASKASVASVHHFLSHERLADADGQLGCVHSPH